MVREICSGCVLTLVGLQNVNYASYLEITSSGDPEVAYKLKFNHQYSGNMLLEGKARTVRSMVILG